MKLKILNFSLCLFIGILLGSCNKQEEKCKGYKPVQKETIQGTWNHIYTDTSLMEYEYIMPVKYKIEFVGDSFFLTRNMFMDVLSVTGCSYLDFKEYMKGTYTIKENQISLWGIRTGENWDPNNFNFCYFRENAVKEFYTRWGIYFCNNELRLEIYDARNKTVNLEHWYYIKMQKE